MTRKVKRIDLKIKGKGYGTVNTHGNVMPVALGKMNPSLYSQYSNIVYGKDNYYIGEDGKIRRVPKCSSGCIRHGTFIDAVNEENMLDAQPEALAAFIASAIGYLRGRMGTKSRVSMSDFEETSGAIYNLETRIKDGYKGKTSLFAKETLGNTEYTGYAHFNVKEAQFLCLDEYFGRKELPTVLYEGGYLEKAFINNLGYVPYTEGVWSAASSVFGQFYGEYGLHFNNEYVNYLLNEFIRAIWELEIQKAEGFMEVTEIWMRVVYDPLEAKDEDYIQLKKEDCGTYNFDFKDFWLPASRQEFEDRTKLVGQIRAEQKAADDAKKEAKKEEEKRRKEEAKAKKEANKLKEENE